MKASCLDFRWVRKGHYQVEFLARIAKTCLRLSGKFTPLRYNNDLVEWVIRILHPTANRPASRSLFTFQYS